MHGKIMGQITLEFTSMLIYLNLLKLDSESIFPVWQSFICITVESANNGEWYIEENEVFVQVEYIWPICKPTILIMV